MTTAQGVVKHRATRNMHDFVAAVVFVIIPLFFAAAACKINKFERVQEVTTTSKMPMTFRPLADLRHGPIPPCCPPHATIFRLGN